MSGVSKDLGVELSFSDFKFSLPNTVYLKDAFVPDQKGDTLFYIQELKVNLRSFNSYRHYIGFGNISIKDGYVNFGVHKGEAFQNHKFFFDYISPHRYDTIPSGRPIWTISFDKIKFENTRFRQFNEDLSLPVAANEFNPHDIQFKQINGEIEKFRVVGDSLNFIAKNVSTVERSGLVVKHFAALTRIYDKGLEFDNLLLQTPNSSLGNTLYFSYDGYDELSDFIKKVHMKGDITNSFLAIKDLLPFGSGLKMFEKSLVKIEGDVTGTIERMRCRNVSIKSLDNTVLEGKFDLTGLPDIQNTYLNFTIDKLHSVPHELFKILDIEMPPDLDRLGYIDYKGRMNGFYNNFVAFGNVGTALGSVRTDINLDFRNGIEDALYSGQIESKGFNLGKFTNNPNIGTVELLAHLHNGVGLTPKHFSFDIHGNIPRIQLFGYPYKAINIEGKFTESLFKGKAFIKDPNLKLDFDGVVDMKAQEEMSDFTVDVYEMNLKALGLDTVESGFTGHMLLSTKGFDIDKITGVLHTKNIEVYRGDKRFNMTDFNVIAEFIDEKRNISLVSDLADIELKGVFDLKILPDAFQNFASNLLPGIVHPSNKKTPSSRIDFLIHLKEIDKLTSMFDWGIEVGKGIIQGAFNSQKKIFGMRINLSKFVISDLHFDNINFRARKGEEKDMKVTASASMYYDDVAYKADSMFLDAVVVENLISYQVSAEDFSNKLKSFAKGNLSFASLDTASLFVEDIVLDIKGRTWKLRDTTSMVIGKYFMLNPIELFNGEQSVSAEYIGSNEHKKIALNLNRFQLENINLFTPETYPEFFGLGNGSIDFRPRQNGMLEIISDLKIDNFAVNTDTVGTIGVKTKRINSFQNELNCDIQSGIFNGVTLVGTIGNVNKYDALDLNLSMPQSDVAIFGQFLKGISKLKGKVGGTVNIAGEPSKPLLNGSLYASDVSFMIDYLKVPFTINSKVLVEKNKITLDKGSQIKDDKGKVGNITGILNHTNFAKWNYNVSIDNLKDFHVLGTTSKDNDLYYGNAYADGSAKIYGTFDKFNISMKAKSKPGSLIVMPLGDTEASGPVSYISFKSDKSDTVAKQQLDVGFLNTMLIEMDITPEMEMQLVLDEQTGETIKGAGRGHITMALGEDDVFTMRGGITVERGDYNFVAFNNMVNKKFFIEKGGTIKWDGDPLQATIDLLTYNIQKASPNPLLGRGSGSTTASQSLTMVQARSEIMIKGNLFSPDITFGLKIPDLADQGMTELSNVLQRVQSDYDEVSRQVFSLLVFGNFMTPTFVTTQMGDLALNPRSMVNNGIADLVSSQIDAWLSQIDDKWLVDFSLANVTPDQRADMIFKLGRKFANNRFIIDGTYGTTQFGYANHSINMEYLVRKDGRTKIKVFSKNQSIYNDANIAAAPVNTFGFGVYYRKEFNSLKKWTRVDTLQNTPKDTTHKQDSFNGSFYFIPRPYSGKNKIEIGSQPVFLPPKMLGLKEDENILS